MEVLSRLSIKALFNCRCVCEDWLSIISDPQFDRLRRSTSPGCILIKTETWTPNSWKSDLSLTFVEECVDSDLCTERMKFTNIVPVSEFNLINSCNGLICLSGRSSLFSEECAPLYVCNPILGEFITIPPAAKAKAEIRMGSFFGIGFSAATNGSGVWRSIGSAPVDSPKKLPFNAYLRGAVHWTSYCGYETVVDLTSCLLKAFWLCWFRDATQWSPQNLTQAMAGLLLT